MRKVDPVDGREGEKWNTFFTDKALLKERKKECCKFDGSVSWSRSCWIY